MTRAAKYDDTAVFNAGRKGWRKEGIKRITPS